MNWIDKLKINNNVIMRFEKMIIRRNEHQFYCYRYKIGKVSNITNKHIIINNGNYEYYYFKNNGRILIKQFNYVSHNYNFEKSDCLLKWSQQKENKILKIDTITMNIINYTGTYDWNRREKDKPFLSDEEYKNRFIKFEKKNNELIPTILVFGEKLSLL